MLSNGAVNTLSQKLQYHAREMQSVVRKQENNLRIQVIMESMKAENQQRQHQGLAPAYTEQDFLDLINK